jgi:uncharacterized protein with ACT and thioredoxin-like domain
MTQNLAARPLCGQVFFGAAILFIGTATQKAKQARSAATQSQSHQPKGMRHERVSEDIHP